jgi:hypothetical protein
LKTDDKIKLVEIFAGTIIQAEMLKDLLENEGITAFLKDEIIGTRSAIWTPSGGVRVIVSDLDFVKAKLIVDEYEKNLRRDGE